MKQGNDCWTEASETMNTKTFLSAGVPFAAMAYLKANDQGHNHNAETFYEVGDRLGRAIAELMKKEK